MTSEATLADRIQFLLSMRSTDEQAIIQALDQIVKDFSVDEVQQWYHPQSKHKNLLIHEFVRMGLMKTIEHAVKDLGFNINAKRESDGNTSLHLAKWYPKPDVSELLQTLGADITIVNNYREVVDGLDQLKEKMMNIIWLDTELTSLDDPHILECAVIITDKHLKELERGQWIVHYEKAELEKLSNFHQNTFKSRSDVRTSSILFLGGNGLFDDILASKTTKEEMEVQLLELLKRHCPEKGCPLAGSSIHWDRAVIRLQLPSVYEYLHYRIIDVSSFFGVVERWIPSERWVEKEKYLDRIMQEKYTDNNREGGVHRAMYDVERSIEILKLFKPCLNTF
ncbi:unnamed protein product [Adineta steineri]|uniref:Exonuclease domain-containing protein n=1 Tax=Adineta steineri TaxID=433720 RepID=A0A815BQ69_9BILA|nr:unnamed protein product [Adineta steineri]CAF4017222.1 unnamed protein product [Adineta steineri]